MKIFSAPLQGYTDCAWRNAHAQVFAGTIDRYYAPFIRLEKGDFRNKDLRDIAPQANTGYRLVPQAIACPAEQLVLIVEKIASMGYGEIDINMGCPFPPVVKRHWGAGILPYPEEVASMLVTLKHFPGIKFSVKMTKAKSVCLLSRRFRSLSKDPQVRKKAPVRARVVLRFGREPNIPIRLPCLLRK